MQRGLDDCNIWLHISSHMYNAPRFRLLQLSVKLPSFPFMCVQVYCEITKRCFVCVFTRFKWLWVFSLPMAYSCTYTSVHNEGTLFACSTMVQESGHLQLWQGQALLLLPISPSPKSAAGMPWYMGVWQLKGILVMSTYLTWISWYTSNYKVGRLYI